ncbi:MAG: hypothetical protein Q7J16_06690 [Candidatus Cloacimonadales bacterium]|nr:hypothetical protein [Candidatus Cloacimonadales bacterium]
MIQVKISISNDLNDFANNFKSLGFKSKSSLFRKALEILISEYKKTQLDKSAELYSEIYSTDLELRELTESAVSDWPE